MMVFFNDPLPIQDHELQAMHLAVAMRARFEGLALAWQRSGYDLGFGIGAAVGHATPDCLSVLVNTSHVLCVESVTRAVPTVR
jgi:ribose 1,5-bisphosphokinase PhnN